MPKRRPRAGLRRPAPRSCGSSTLSSSVPIAAEHAGWPVVATVARTHASNSSSVLTSGPGWISAATADANGSVETISRVRRIARTNAATSPAAVSVFNWIAGGAAASGDRAITLPRLAGVQIRLQDRQGRPWIRHLVDPRVDRRVNELKVRRGQAGCRTNMRDGPHQVARQLAGAANQPAQQPLRIASVGQTDETGCQVPVHERSGMVREVVTHPRAVHRGIDPDRAQMLGRPYAGQLQQLGRAVSARTEHDFMCALSRMTTRRTSAPVTNEKFGNPRA